MGWNGPNRGVISGLIGSAALGLLLCGGALAQGDNAGGAKSGETAGADALKSTKVTMNAEQENLVDAIRTLMKSAKADFVIDEDLKGGTATVHFKDVLFTDALSTLVKVSTIPIAFEVKDGIYHFKHRVDPPVEEKQPDPAVPPASRTRAGRVPVEQISSAAAMRKLTGAYDTPPPTIFQRSSTPISHGSTSSFGFNGNGLLQSNSTRYNPDGSISHSGAPPLNIFGLLRGLLGGIR